MLTHITLAIMGTLALGAVAWANLRYWSALRAMSPAERAAYLEDERQEMAIW